MSDVHEGKGLFYIGDSEQPEAELYYEEKGSTIVITSTFVKEERRGEGLGKKLIDYAVNCARKNKGKIDPECPFARKVMENTPEYQVVLV